MVLLERLKKWAVGWLRGGPHFVVGDPARPYLHRWYVVPRNPLCNIYIHKFLRDDDDRALHDHPWPSISVCLWGRYLEQTPDNLGGFNWHHRRIGSVVFRRATYAHRIELPGGKPAWTLFITGPKVREWGFHCPGGWIHWQAFTRPGRPGEIGPGCDQP